MKYIKRLLEFIIKGKNGDHEAEVGAELSEIEVEEPYDRKKEMQRRMEMMERRHHHSMF